MEMGERKGSNLVSQMKCRGQVGTEELFQHPEGLTAYLAAGQLLDPGTGTSHPPLKATVVCPLPLQHPPCCQGNEEPGVFHSDIRNCG